MAVRGSAKEVLPTSHVFITVARGRSARTFMARSSVVIAAVLVVPLAGLWLAASTLYLVFHDDLVATLMLRQRDMQYAYEDKIASLRSQINLSASRQLMSQRSVEAKLDELTSREADLQMRSGVVARLEDQTSRLVKGAPETAVGPAGDVALQERTDTMAAPISTPAAEPASLPSKPQPEAAVAIPATEPGSAFDKAEQTPSTSFVPQRLSALSSRLDAISTGQEQRIARLDRRVRTTVAHYHDALATAGLSEHRFLAGDAMASGGPFVPLPSGQMNAFTRAATDLQLTLGQAERLRSSIARVPFNKPLAGDPEMTSPFGARVDPFLGRPAMHTGIDLAEGTGTDVRATAPGRVTVAGPVSGYGSMVEVDHGAGLTTRYAHMSEVDVAVGQLVKLGEIVGKVGQTGRATGPHLHYETRIDGEPVDPLRFLAAGQQLVDGRQGL